MFFVESRAKEVILPNLVSRLTLEWVRTCKQTPSMNRRIYSSLRLPEYLMESVLSHSHAATYSSVGQWTLTLWFFRLFKCFCTIQERLQTAFPRGSHVIQETMDPAATCGDWSHAQDGTPSAWFPSFFLCIGCTDFSGLECLEIINTNGSHSPSRREKSHQIF